MTPSTQIERGLERFTVTDEHLKLARRMYIRYEDAIEFGGPAIDPKRPYGNGDVYRDMREILGYPDPDDDPDIDGDEASMLRLHKEMATVLQIALRTGRFEAGEYVADRYSRNWRPA